MSNKVELCIYDMEEQIKQTFGISVPKEKIWHSSIVVYGKEYSFGADGITTKEPSGTPYTRKTMGYTIVPKTQFDKYIERLKSTWMSSTYHLLYKNCHNFSQLLVQYLDVSDLPAHISLLPQELRLLGVKLGLEAIINGLFESVTKTYRSSSQ